MDILNFFEPLETDSSLRQLRSEIHELEEKERTASQIEITAGEAEFTARQAAEDEDVKREMGEKADPKAARARFREALAEHEEAQRKWRAVSRALENKRLQYSARLREVRQEVQERTWSAAKEQFQRGIMLLAELSRVVADCCAICDAMERQGLPFGHANFLYGFKSEFSDSYVLGPGDGTGVLCETRLSLLFDSARGLGNETPPLAVAAGATNAHVIEEVTSIARSAVSKDRQSWRGKVKELLDFTEELIAKE